MIRAGALAALAPLLAGCVLGPLPTPPLAPTPTVVPSVAPSASSSPAASATPRPLPAGAVAQLLVGGVRLRGAASADTSALAVLQAGQRVVIVSGPLSEGRYQWYEVSRGRDAAPGWVAAGAGGQPWLAQVSNGRIAMRYAEAGRVGIGLVNADGGKLSVLEGDPLRLAWSPDGKLLAVALRNPRAQPAIGTEVYVMRADGSDRHLVARGTDFAWSPDGTRLAVAETGRIILHDPQTGQDIGRLPLAPGAVAEMTWSPDGSLIALTAAASGTGRDVYVVRSDSGALIRLSSGGVNAHPAWSPSGHSLVFDSPDGVLLADPAGGDLRPVSKGLTGAAFSPDGIFLLIARLGGLDVLDTRLQGSDTLARDDARTVLRPGSWSPDGTQILYQRAARQGGALETWVVNRDGSAALKLPGQSSLAVWQPLLAAP
jgi:TolB protein